MKLIKFLLQIYLFLFFFNALSQDIFMQNGTSTQCAGIFYDSGGDTNDYAANENFTYTICPESADLRVVLEFSEFKLADGGVDVMSIYDSNTTDPSALLGDFTGTILSEENFFLNNISASDGNLSGCLTIVFSSSPNVEDTGWQANISCREACAEIDVNLESISSTIFDGSSYKLCFGEQIIFEANASIDFGNPELLSLNWDFDDGNTANGQIVDNTFSEAGIYDVSLTANYPGCSSQTLFFELQVASEPEIILSTDTPQVCIGDELEFVATTSTVTVTEDCGTPESELTFLPDGTGLPYTTSIQVDCFDNNQTINSASDIVEVCMVIEHSFLNDLDIVLIAPDGNQVILVEPNPQNNNEEIFLGDALDNDSTTPGIGFEYCFKISASSILSEGPTVIVQDNPAPEAPDVAIQAGDYLPIDSFNDLIGSPINGEWAIQIFDNVPFDNGYIFEWFINFNPDIVPVENVFTPQIIKQDWIGFEGVGNTINLIASSDTGQECYQYLVLDDYGCTYTREICADVFPLPEVDNTQNLFTCETDPESPANFNLNLNNPNVLGNQNPNNFNITYHTNASNAENGTNPINNPTNYTSNSRPETIFVRLESVAGCFETASFTLLSSILELTEIDPLGYCTNEDAEIVDLSSKNPEIYGPSLNETTHSITFFNSETDAELEINAIDDPENYESNTPTETIWFKIENINEGCFLINSFEIIRYELPVITETPINIEECFGPDQTYNLTVNNTNTLGVSVTINTEVSYHTSLQNATNNSNAIADPQNYQNSVDTQTIWVRVSNAGFLGCFAVSSFELTTLETAEINFSPTPIVQCDDNNDGFFLNFDLSTKDEEINLANSSVEVSYHLTEEDARNNIGDLNSPYTNIIPNTQTIFFRTLDTTNGCIQVGELELQVIDSPILNPINQPIFNCVDDQSPFSFFDLTQVESIVTVTPLPEDYLITYHLSEEDAQLDFNALGQPQSFQNNSNPQTIWVRVTDISNDKRCYNIESFSIETRPRPEIANPLPLGLCEDISGGSLTDGIASFDLSTKVNEINLNNSSIEVEFFSSQEDIDNNLPIENILTYQNITNPQTLQVKATDSNNGCESFTTLTIFVNAVPTLASEIEPLEACDTDNDGLAEFDLSSITDEILNGQSNVTITYHLSQAQAELGENALDTSVLYSSITPNIQTIFVRAENTGGNGDDGTGCYDIRPIDLVVNENPNIQELLDIKLCDDDTPNGFTNFDLTLNNPLILGSQNADDFEITFYEDQESAELGTNQIVFPSNYTNLSNPQTIFVRLENINTGCVDLFNSNNDVNNSFTIEVEPLPEIFSPTDLELCNDELPDVSFPVEVFNLTDKEAEILGVENITDDLAFIQFTYYLTSQDLENDTNPIGNPEAFINFSSPQDIFVKVVDLSTEQLCFRSTVLTLNVLPLPTPSETNPDVLRQEVCDEDNDGITDEPFNLTESGVLIAESENVNLTYYKTEEGAENEEENFQITNPGNYINETEFNLLDNMGNPTNIQTIYVRVDNGVEGNFCHTIVSFEIVVHSSPVINPIGNPFGYTLCEDDNTNPGQSTIPSLEDITFNLWNFTSGNINQSIPLLDPNVSNPDISTLEIKYYTTEIGAQQDFGIILAGDQVENGDTIFFNVTNPDSGCSNIGEVKITVEARPFVNTDVELPEINVCEDTLENPFVTTVDLTDYDNLIDLNPGNNTFIVYYDGEENLADNNPIDDPFNFETSQATHTIFTRIVDADTLCDSDNFVSFDIIVSPLPLLDISNYNGVSVCFDANGDLIENEFLPPVIDTGLSEADYTFVWQKDGQTLSSTSSSIVAFSGGTYTVTTTNILTGCLVSSSATLIESTAPVIDIQIISSAFSVFHAVDVSVVEGSEQIEFRLDDGDWVGLDPGKNSVLFFDIHPGLHTITARDVDGCVVIENFTMIDYPRFFTPNQDGFNDNWNISSLSNQADAKIFIFDKFGKLLKQISTFGEGWDGTYQGKNMPSQTYWFMVEYVEPTTSMPMVFKSHFILKR